MYPDRTRRGLLHARGWQREDAARRNALASIEPGILVVGTSPVSTAGLSSVLREAGLDVVGRSAGIERAAAMARRLRPDAILVDIDGPGPSGIAAIRRIADSAPRARVAVLFAGDDPDLLSILEAGAYACTLKAAPMHDVLAATRAAARGELVVATPVVRMLVSRVEPDAADAVELTSREREVLELLALGWDNRRIAAVLYVSHATVKRHISNILRKLDVDNRIQAAVRAVKDGLFDP